MSEVKSEEKRVKRREFEMTQAQYDAILAASQPVPYMVFGGVEPSSPRENAHRAWRNLGGELGFDWETVRPSERGKMFFTAVVIDPTYLTPCPVCGSEEDCPHTPVRCQHRWWYGEEPAGPWPSPPTLKAGLIRTCELCKRKEKAAINWDTVKP